MIKFPFHKHKAGQQKSAERPVPRSNFMHEVRRDPFLDWALILGFAAIVAIGLVSVGFYVYLDTGDRLDSSIVGESPNAKSVFDEAALEVELSRFEGLADERDAIGRSYSAPRDPSLP